jgi:hypothetical protein
MFPFRWFIKQVECKLHVLFIYMASLFCLLILLSSSEDFLFRSLGINYLMEGSFLAIFDASSILSFMKGKIGAVENDRFPSLRHA